MTVYVFQVGVFEPINVQTHDTRGFVQRIEGLRMQKPGALVFYKVNPDGLAIKYLVNAKMDFLPRFIDDPAQLKDNSSPVWLLTKEENADELRRAGIDVDGVGQRDRFAGEPFLVVYRPASVPAR